MLLIDSHSYPVSFFYAALNKCQNCVARLPLSGLSPSVTLEKLRKGAGECRERVGVVIEIDWHRSFLPPLTPPTIVDDWMGVMAGIPHASLCTSLLTTSTYLSSLTDLNDW